MRLMAWVRADQYPWAGRLGRMHMTGEKVAAALGWRVYGVGIIALGLVCVAFGDFHPGQPVPKEFPLRTPLAYAVAIFMLATGVGVEWRRTTARAAAALAVYFAMVVVLVMNGRVLIAHYEQFGPYE